MDNFIEQFGQFGFPVGLCLALIWLLHRMGKWAVRVVVEPVVRSHQNFLQNLELQMDTQGKILHELTEVQGKILKKLRDH